MSHRHGIGAVGDRGFGWRGSIWALGLALLVATMGASAQEVGTGIQVTVPNGYLNVAVDDLTVQSTAGAVRWSRTWDGQEWKFNSYWESLSQSWKNLTGSKTADTTGSTLANGPGLASSGGSADDGCWVWVDEDWQPSTGTVTIGG